MVVLLFLLLFGLVNIGLMVFCLLADNPLCIYDTRSCRDVRVSMHRVYPPIDLDIKRRKLKRSKF